jgi:methylaspartate mutase sigma subunit
MTETRKASDGALPTSVKTVLVTSTASDSHTWNLVFLQLMLEESGYVVHNLGACPSVATVLRECRAARPDLLLVSSVNGHGRAEGAELISALRRDADLRDLPAVIGGMLTTGHAHPAQVRAELMGCGYSGVFMGESALSDFRCYLRSSSSLADASVG